MRAAALLGVALLLVVPGCVGKFRDADYRISDRLGVPENGTHYRIYTFYGDAHAKEFVVRSEYRFESWTRFTYYDAHRRLSNNTLLTEEAWESDGEWTMSMPRDGKDWSGTWTFTVETKGPAWYTLGFDFQ